MWQTEPKVVWRSALKDVHKEWGSLLPTLQNASFCKRGPSGLPHILAKTKRKTREGRETVQTVTMGGAVVLERVVWSCPGPCGNSGNFLI